MIFATDIDRTLIYSHLFLDQAECEYQLVEERGEKPIAYMSEKAIELIKVLDENAHIVPISLRNENEYHRIKLFSEVIRPEIYVTNNGGTIYYRGEEDKTWTAMIKGQLEKMKSDYEQVKKDFFICYQGKIEKIVSCGKLVWLFLGERDQIDYQGIELFRYAFYQEGWRIDVSGRKIYIYPDFVTKWRAILYIRETYYNESIFAAGDSIFDQEMVEKADYGIIPKKSYIEKQIKPHVRITEHEGMEAAEDILIAALKQSVFMEI